MVSEAGFWSDWRVIDFLDALKLREARECRVGKLRLGCFGGVFRSRQKHHLRGLQFEK